MGATPPQGTSPAPGNLKPMPRAQLTAVRLKVRASHFGDLEEHEIIHLLDALNDERARAQFRESIYISTILCLAVAWFLFYGPHILFHQPYYKDPIAAMKERDQQLTLVTPSTPKLKPAPPKPVIDKKTMAQLQKEAREAPPAPSPQPPQPQEEAHNAAPPVPQPPLPAAPPAPASVPAAPLPAAPQPKIATNSQSAHDALQNAMKGALSGRSGAEIGAPGRAGPLQAGAEILSDTQGVDFSAYMRRLHDDIQRNWNPLIPEEVEPPLLKKGIVGIRFIILPDGQIGGIKLETTSGDVALDKAAWYAITSEGQFPSLPKQFHGPDLELRVGFFYNEPIQE
jgi:outer membrane biosynthesis protein TonB